MPDSMSLFGLILIVGVQESPMSHINSQNLTPSKYTHRYTPRHPLAKEAISQIEKCERRSQDIVQAMGYPPKHIISACDRLRHVLSSDILGLNATDIDSYFTAHEFLKALLSVLDIKYDTFAEDIAQIQYDLAHYPYPLPQYQLRAFIDFTWSEGANWMSRGVASSKAVAYLPQNIAKMNAAKRELVIQQCLAAHYAEYNGHLPYNGVINGYQLIIEQRHEMVDSIEYDLPQCE